MLNQTAPVIGEESTLKGQNLLGVVAIDIAISVVLLITMAMCAWFVWYRHSLQREERDKLGRIMQQVYWDHEQEILQLLDILQNLRQAILFREVTQIQVLAYKYRTKNQMLLANEDFVTFSIITKIQHFFERIQLELPLKGKCPKNVSACIKSTVYKLGVGCIEFWDDSQVGVLQVVMKYFCGALAGDVTAKWISDEELASLIETRVPYVDQLQFNINHFVLADMKYEQGMKIDFCSKVRYIDVILARSDPCLQSRQKFLLSIYNTAREFCFKHEFITQKNLLPDIPPLGQTEPVSIHDIVMYVRHLIRILCMDKNLQIIQSDDRFCKMLLSLYEQMYGVGDPVSQLEVIDRIKKNIVNSLDAIRPEQMGPDLETVRFKLEEVERGLSRHINMISLSQETKRRRRDLLAAHQHQSARSFESEVSVYTMALSASAFALQRQGTCESDLATRYTSPQHSLIEPPPIAPNGDVASFVNENTPLISNTPPTPLGSSPRRPQSPLSRPESPTDRCQSPMSIDSDYVETAV